MERPTVQDIFLRFYPKYLDKYTPSPQQSKEIRSLKAGLSGIVRQHGFATVQDFYTSFYTAQRAIDAYQKE